jgi:hypothetical protein
MYPLAQRFELFHVCDPFHDRPDPRVGRAEAALAQPKEELLRFRAAALCLALL